VAINLSEKVPDAFSFPTPEKETGKEKEKEKESDKDKKENQKVVEGEEAEAGTPSAILI